MTTEKQILANRFNALKSTGPHTAEGKAIASRNALTHGLLSRRILLKDENPGEFDVFYLAILHDLTPVGQMEIFLAERIIAHFWRLKRTGRMETALLEVLYSQQDQQDRLLRSVQAFTAMTAAKASDISQTDLSDSTLLGRVVKNDFQGGNLISRLLRYEGEMERSLYKAILELQKLQYVRKHNEALYGDAQNISDRPNSSNSQL